MNNDICISPLFHMACCFAVILSFIIGAQYAGANVLTANSDGYGLQVDLDIQNLIAIDLLNLTPEQISSGTAPQTYDESATLIPADTNVSTSLASPLINTSVQLDLATTTGILSSTATSDVGSVLPSYRTQAHGQVDGLDLSVVDADVTVLGIPTLSLNLLDITATTIASTATVEGDAEALIETGRSTIQNLSIRVKGIELDLLSLLGGNASVNTQGFLTVTPNTELLSIGGVIGLDLTLNQQIVSNDDITGLGIEVNAVRLTFNGIDLGLPLVNETLQGDIRIGHSQAFMSVVPEPAGLLLISSGLSLVAMRPRKNT